MKTLKVFRHEYKYVIPYEDMLKLRKKLDDVLTIDRNKEGYLIRSLYFDSLSDNDYYDKLGGEVNRKKIRLRIYEANANFVKLEMKSKYDIHQLKRSVIIDRKAAEDIINENYEVLLEYDNVAKEIYTILRSDLYKPKTIIEYTRIAYVSTLGTRITFDLNIKKSDDFANFFNEDINYYEISNKTDVVLEIKFDRYLEPYLSQILASYDARLQSVSKYVMGRNE